MWFAERTSVGGKPLVTSAENYGQVGEGLQIAWRAAEEISEKEEVSFAVEAAPWFALVRTGMKDTRG